MTEAGKAFLRGECAEQSDGYCIAHRRYAETCRAVRERIAAIEAEAVATERARIAGLVREMLHRFANATEDDTPPVPRIAAQGATEACRAVLAAIEGESK